ncbi:MAG: pitrilysin family protein [Myxococcota bacterium]|nr:pitrilysin family protein [Myxococcota bacterium]
MPIRPSSRLHPLVAPALFAGAFLLLVLPSSTVQASPMSSSKVAEATPFEDGWPGMPVPGPAPEFEVPTAENFRLSNGMPVTYIQRGSIPLVHLSLTIHTGSSADPMGKEGLSAFTADMMNEATSTRDAFQISDELQRMATDLGLGSGLDQSSLGLNCLEDQLAGSLSLAADILSNPTFPEAAVQRVRGDRKNRLLTERDSIGTVNYKAFARILFGEHYAGRPTSGTAASLDRISGKDMVKWHRQVWKPSNASLVVVGRRDLDTMKELLEAGLGSWTASTGGKKRHVNCSNCTQPATTPVAALVSPERAEGVHIYWVHRPGASQSYIQVGNVTPAFDEEKHQAWSLANMVLGGQFSSRLNLNLREDKGYTYGARTGIWDGPQGGMFRARSSVRTATTAPALFEFFKEIREILGERPITDQEFDAVVSRSKQGYPARFENMGSVLGMFARAVANRRPVDWLLNHDARVDGVSREVAQSSLAAILDPASLVVVVVGDWHAVVDSPESAEGSEPSGKLTVGAQVRGLKLGEVTFLDEDGLPADEPAAPAEANGN